MRERIDPRRRRMLFELLESRLHLSAGPDVFETDNDCGHASSIATGGAPQAHSIHEATDVDWVRFSLTQVSHVTLETGGAAGDTKLWLFRSGECGWSEAISYDYDSGAGYFSKIEEYLEPGDYFAAVTEEGQNATIESYTLTVTAVGLANKKDACEDDNTAQAAQPIASGATQVHSLHVPYDVDWVTFSVSQASRATLTATGGGGRVALRLFGPNDPARQISYDYYPDGAVLAEVVAYLQPGVYHASVGSYYQDSTLDSYALGLNLVPLTDLDDGFEPDNDAGSATQLFLDGTPQPHSIHQPSDVDWATFQLVAPARVTIETDGLEGDTWMALYASTNLDTPIATDFDSGNGEFSRIVAFLDPGTYYVHVHAQERYQDATIDSYILSAVSVALADLDDDFEDDGASATAKQIQANGPAQEHSIHRPTDVDWCWFALAAPSRVTLETDGPEGETWMELYASTNLGSYIASDGDSGCFSRIVAYLEPGTYYVKTQEYYQNTTIDRYTLSLQTTPLADLADAYEEDGTWATAKPIEANGPAQEHNIHRPTDVDWCSFALAAPSRVILETDGPEGDTWMELYASTNLGSYIASDDDSGNGEFSRVVAYLEPGNYRVKVQEYNRDSTIDHYTLSLQATPLDELKDAYEGDNLPAAAHVIATNGAPEVHNIHHPDDVDWFKFHLAAASRVTLETDGPDGNTWMAIYAGGALDTPIASDSYSGNGDLSRIVQYHLDAGDYYASVQENGQDATIARYTMSVAATPLATLRDAQEADDSPSAASPLVATDGTRRPRTLHEPSDVDWARFTLAAPSNVVIATDGPSGDTQMWLFGPGNWTTQIAYDDDSGKDAFARIAASLGAGTYYVKISEYGQNQPVDDYAVSVFAVPQANPRDAYETDDSAAQAVLIPADGSRRAHNFHNGADVDWVKFDVLAPSKVIVETDGADGDTQLRLFAEGSYDWSDPLSYDDDGGYGAFSRIVAYLPPGRYYAAASEYGQNNPIDHFTLAVTASAVDALKDASENPGDDTAAGASVVALDAPTPVHSIHEPADVDWFRFRVDDASMVTLVTSGRIDESNASIRVSLFGPNNSTILVTERSGSGASSQLQRVLAPGTYFVCVADGNHDSGIAEYSLQASATRLGDLAIVDGSLSTDLPVGIGETVTVRWTAQNLGPGDTDPYQDGYESWDDEIYLSLDDQLDGSDRYLGYSYRSGAPLSAGSQYSAARSVTIPNDTDWAGRNAYLLVVVDGDADLVETDETNNALAIPIQTKRYVSLVAPYEGRFLDTSSPAEFRWVACDAQPGATVSLAIDTDANPANGGYQWILRDWPVADQNAVERAALTLPCVTPRSESYYVWAVVGGSQGSTYSEAIPVFVAERAYGSTRVASDPVGGSRYTVAGIEAAELAGEYYIRVRTSFRPDGGSGGDLHILAGDTVYGLCVHSHTIADGTRVVAGDLYEDAEFLTGTYVSSVPTFLDGYATHISGKSSVRVIETPDSPWDYEILATIDADALTPAGAAQPAAAADADDLNVGWSMYCGNDTDRVAVPKDKPDVALTSLSYSPENGTAQFSYAISGENLTSVSDVAVYWAIGTTRDDVIGSALFTTSTATAQGSYGPITVPAAALQNKPREAAYLVAVADPYDAVEERNEDNNVQSAAVTLNVKLIKLEATGDIDILDEATRQKIPDVIWERSGGPPSACKPIADGIADSQKGVTLTVTVESNGSPQGQTEVDWSLSGPSSTGACERLDWQQAGTNTWKATFVVNPPDVIGEYELTMDFLASEGVSLDGPTITTTLYRTFAQPPQGAKYYGPYLGNTFREFPEKAFKMAVAAAAGSTASQGVQALENVMHFVYGLGWTYTTDYINCSILNPAAMPPDWIPFYSTNLLLYRPDDAKKEGKECTGQNVPPLADCNCYTLAWASLGRVLGLNAETKLLGNLGMPFVWQPVAVSSSGEIGNTIAPEGPEWVFFAHQIGLYNGSQFDPTFDRIGGSVGTVFLTPPERGVDGSYAFYAPDRSERLRVLRDPNAREGRWQMEAVIERAPFSAAALDVARLAGSSHFGAGTLIETIDANGDGVFDVLRVEADVHGVAGDYTVHGVIRKGNTAITSRATSETGEFSRAAGSLLSDGVAVIPLHFSGEDIRQSGLDGVFTVDLVLVADGGGQLDFVSVNTVSLDHRLFGELPVRLGSSANSGRDVDADGRFDRLNVNVSIDVAGAQEYAVFAALTDARGRVIDSAEATAREGLQQCLLAFDGRRISAAGVNGPYYVQVSVEDEDGRIVASENYTTLAYAASQFEAPPVRVAGPVTETPVDSNGNGRFEMLAINVRATVDQAGDYDLQAWLCDSQGSMVDSIVAPVSLAAGVQPMTLAFDGRTIAANGKNGPYQVEYVSLRRRSGGEDEILCVAEDLYTTASYQASQFEIGQTGVVVDLRLVHGPSAFDNPSTGERNALPENLEWIVEWDACWVEIWVSAPDAGVGSARVDLAYDAACFTPAAIEYGPAFTENRTGTVHDDTGVVSQLGAATLAADVGNGCYVLLARVKLDSSAVGDAAGVPVALDTYPAACGCDITLSAALAAQAGGAASAAISGSAPQTELWPVMYDLDDDGEVGLGDLAYFAAAYRHMTDDFSVAYTQASDFDHDGEVGLGDLSYFAAAYRREHTDTEPIANFFPPNFPDDWRSTSESHVASQAVADGAAGPVSVIGPMPAGWNEVRTDVRSVKRDIGPIPLLCPSMSHLIVQKPDKEATDAVMAEQYGPSQIEHSGLQYQRLAWSYTLARRRSHEQVDRILGKTALAIDLLLAIAQK